MWAVVIGQAQIVVTFLTMIATPLSIALASGLKVFPAFVALFWLGRRDWRLLTRLVAWLVALAVVSFVLEPSGTIAYVGFLRLDQVGEVWNLSPVCVVPGARAGLVVVGALVVVVGARSRYGWAMTVAFSVLVNPRLLVYHLGSLFACLGSPRTRAAASDGVPESSPGPGVSRGSKVAEPGSRDRSGTVVPATSGRVAGHAVTDEIVARNLTRGTILGSRLGVADSLWAKFMGLMGRPSLEPDAGLWLPDSNGIHMMFMRFPIDAVFVGRRDPGGSCQVVSVHRGLRTWIGLVPLVRGAHGVLELPVGTIDRTATEVGDTLVLA